MFDMTFWRAIFLIGVLLLLILKYRDGLDITKTLPAGIIAFILSFIGNIALDRLGLISYNPAKLESAVFGVSLFQQISSGIIAMLMVHYLPKKLGSVALYIAGISIIVNFIVYIAEQLNVIRFVRWGYIENFIFDFIALGIVFGLYQLLKAKYEVTT